MRITFGVLLLSMLTTLRADARDKYKVTVTREETNFYRVDGTDYYVKTRLCLELAMRQEAILVWNGRGSFSNKLIFISSYRDAKSCDVEAVLVETEPR
jgi:hypothetical protein